MLFWLLFFLGFLLLDYNWLLLVDLVVRHLLELLIVPFLLNLCHELLVVNHLFVYVCEYVYCALHQVTVIL